MFFMRYFSDRKIFLFLVLSVIGAFSAFALFTIGQEDSYGDYTTNFATCTPSCNACSEFSDVCDTSGTQVCLTSDCSTETKLCNRETDGISCDINSFCYNSACVLTSSGTEVHTPSSASCTPFCNACEGFSDVCDESGMQFCTLFDCSTQVVSCIRQTQGISCGSNSFCYQGACTFDSSAFDIENIQPSVSLFISPSGTIAGQASIGITVDYAKYVELYLVREGSLVPAYLGTAFLEAGSRWKYAWDSHATPNGTYYLFARITNRFGTYESAKKLLDVFNGIEKITTSSPEAIQQIEQEIQQIKDISTEVQAIESASAPSESEFKTETSNVITDYSARINESIQATAGVDVEALRRRVIRRTQEIRTAFEEFLNSEITNLAQAIRAENEINIERVRNRIREVFVSSLVEIDRVVSDAGITFDTRSLKSGLEKEFERTLEELQILIAKREEIIRERVGLNGFRDTDNDGIADYDEINIYTTNPAVADTDGDGFIDGAEILGGFNPVDASQEAAIRYEDPHEAGIEQQKLFAIENVSVESTVIDEETQAPTIEKIRFSGIALPNSFVTLYIFSDPIIVTVKTDNGGKWSYVFDKRLADGTHEVFAAITDNTGHIVAKSAAVPFVKEAQALAFGEDNINAFLAGDTSPGFFKGNFRYIAVGFFIGIFTIALIALGRRKTKERSAG